MSDKEEVKNLRRKFGLTQTDFAEKIGVTRELVSHIERGAKPISKATRIMIDNFLKTVNLVPEKNSENYADEPKVKYDSSSKTKIASKGDNNNNNGGNVTNNYQESVNKPTRVYGEDQSIIDNVVFNLQNDLIEIHKKAYNSEKEVSVTLRMVIEKDNMIIERDTKIIEGKDEVINTQKMVIERDQQIKEKDKKIVELLEKRNNESR